MPRKPDLSIIGKIFNDLTVLEYTDKRNSYGRGLYRCKCNLCGGTTLATKSNLVRGEVKNCGCTRHDPKSKTDLRGQKINMLTVKDIVIIDNKMRYVCECECGNTCLANPQDLKRGTKKSCGCLHKSKITELFVDGTAPCKLDSSKIRSSNTSGVTGVYRDKVREKWYAEITFKSKKYYLGRYNSKDDAIDARKEAEKQMFGDFLAWYNETHPKKSKYAGVNYNSMINKWFAAIQTAGKEYYLGSYDKEKDAIAVRKLAEKHLKSNDFYEWLADFKNKYKTKKDPEE